VLDRTLWFGLAAVLALLGLSAWQPHDYPTWAMEVAPVFIVAPILVAAHQRFPLTGLVYALIALHAVILMVGGHYTYASGWPSGLAGRATTTTRSATSPRASCRRW
jgi:uncharacterized membrane protein YjdF